MKTFEIRLEDVPSFDVAVARATEKAKEEEYREIRFHELRIEVGDHTEFEGDSWGRKPVYIYTFQVLKGRE